MQSGVKHVFVNGVQVLKDGQHTGAKTWAGIMGARKSNVHLDQNKIGVPNRVAFV